MKFKKSMLILILAVFLISIAGVCASDVDDTAVASQDSTEVELTQIDESEEISSADEGQAVGQTDNQEIISADGKGTFAELESEIRNGYNSTITLGRDYEYEGSGYTVGIKITQSITIDGNGSTIDAKGKAMIFDIFSTNVIIKNITFKNARVQSYGAATYWNINSSGSLSGCVFESNVAYGGAAIYGESATCNVSDCVFRGNTVNEYRAGGAIFFNNGGNYNVYDCVFENNVARYAGGAIFLNGGNCNIYSCVFRNNNAGRMGGAIYWGDSINNKRNVHDCVFVSNSADQDGGAIYSSSGSGKISGCYFANNTGEWGIIALDFGKYMSINDNIFLNNNGDPIHYEAYDFITNADYNWFGNNADNYGNNPGVTGCNVWLFLNATADPDEICIFDSSDIVFKLYAYNSNEVSEYDNSRLNAVNLTLTPTNGRVNTTKTHLGEAVQYTAEGAGIGTITASIDNAAYTATLKIRNFTFFDLNRTINGNNNDTIVLDNDYTYNSTFDTDFNDGIVIDRPVTIIGNGHTLNAAGMARIFNIQADDVVIRNITFANAKIVGDKDGGAIYWNGDNGDVSGCAFVNNTVSSYSGGAIYFENNGSVTYCNFTNNTAFSDGGAIFMSSGTVENCNFINNKAFSGGAISIYKCDVKNCNFTENTAHYGAAIIFYDDGNVTNCNFISNQAERRGGALFFYGDTVITNCNFTGNNAPAGSAIYFSFNVDNKMISNSIFLNNRADVDEDTPLQIAKNDNKIEITFMGQNNLLNAIYSDEDKEVSFTNVTYWGANGITNTGSITVKPSRSNKEAGQNITLVMVVNDVLILNETKVTDENGTIVLDAVAGYYTISARHDEDSYYTEAETTETLIMGIETSLELKASGLTVTARIIPDVGIDNITFTVENESGIVKTVETTLNDGIAELDLTGLVPGKYDITATYAGNINYCPSSNNITVSTVPTTLNADDLIMAYKDGSKWNVTLTDADCVAISGRVVKFGIKDKIYSIVTDENGVAGLPINLIPDTYDINATFEGDNDYGNSFVNATVTVTQAVATLSGVDLNMTYKDGSAWAVTLTNADGDAIAGVKVAIGVAGKVYYIKTDDEGVAKLPINLPANTYTVNASFTNAQYEAELITATVTVNKAVPVLSAKDLVMNYKDGSAWNVTLKDAQGNAMANTYVKLTVAGKTYNRKTNSEGVVSLPINLGVGNYNITALFSGSANFDAVEITNAIVVNPPEYNFFASDVNMTYQDGTNYMVHITDGEGNPVAKAGVVIKMTINGKSYNRKTNEEGIASLPIGLRAGTYTITAEYNGRQITNTIVVN